jgi:aminoglycoside phosphotransferase (APT) family kinase protein
MEMFACTAGRSNLTTIVRFGDEELVLRRPPCGPVAPKAHDIVREFRWLSAIHPVFPLAPRPYLVCEDPSIIGSVFSILERRHGVVVFRDEPAGLAEHPMARRRAGHALVDALADLHAIDASAGPLARIGRPEGFLARQVVGWSERWTRSKGEDVPEMTAVDSWLRASIPVEPVRAAIVHGDFKLDNVMLDRLDEGRVSAVLDWEMCAIGDPLVDLGTLLAYWGSTGPPGTEAHQTVTMRPGWPSPDEIVGRYAERSGRNLSSIRFYEVFALFKVATIIQQLYARHLSGHARDSRYEGFGDRVRYVAERAAALVG